MRHGTAHIVGAGLAGLSAAVKLTAAGRNVIVHELAKHAGGRCRSYFEPALGLTIDNGNHLLLSGNRSALAYAERIGAHHLLTGPEQSEFPFCDLASGERWTLRPNDGALPWWIFSKARRAPGTRAPEYMALARLFFASDSDTVDDKLDRESGVYKRLARPVLLAALNCGLSEASARLAGAVIRDTLARGGGACRPLVAAHGLGPALVDPAISYVERHGGVVRFDNPLRALQFAGDHVRALNFPDEAITIGPADRVILAAPAWVAKTLVPGLAVPTEYRSFLNVHFKTPPPRGMPVVTGIINGTTEWLFAFDNRLSVTVSAADRFNEMEREPLARKIWTEVSKVSGLDTMLPPWSIVKERRATFAATPSQNALRPGAVTQWKNLHLAGDWTQTGFPATIEGAIRSGETAAKLAMAVPT
jgi:squalene-associated FAD-dependent desaturase